MPEEFDAYRKWLGIPLQDQPPDHYRLLGIIPFEDDPEVIENAANRQMGHIRTFQSGKHGRLSQKILNEISTAKICLLNPAKKANYDAALRGEPAPVTNVEMVDADPPVAPPPQQGGLQMATVGPPRVDAAAAPGGVVVVGAPARTGRPKPGARASRSKSSSHLMPILLFVICALVMAAAVAMALNWNELQKLLGAERSAPSTKQHDPSKHLKRDTSTTPAPNENPEKKPASKSATKPPQEEDGFKPHPTIPPLPAPLNKAGREAEFQRLTGETRRALEEGMLESATRLLVEAESFQGTEKDHAAVHHLRMLRGHLGDFWHEVRQGIYAVEIGKPFDFRSDEFVLVRREGDLVTYKAGGEEHTGHVREIEPKAALAFAQRAPEQVKPRSLVSAATFLTLDSRGGLERHAWMLSQARKMWHEAARLGVKDSYLAHELRIDPNGEPEPEPEDKADSRLSC